MTRYILRTLTVASWFTGLVLAPAVIETAGAEPLLTLKMPAFQGSVFPNGSSIVLPASGHGDFEVWLQDALAEIQVSTIRVRLNESPMATFLAINKMPRGVRVIVKLGLSINPQFSLQQGRENLVTFAASDASGVTYQAQFYLALEATAPAPRLAERATVRPPVREVVAPPQVFPPRVILKGAWPAQTNERVLTLEAEVQDMEGLRRIVVEVNSKPVEEIVLENELPVRKQRGFIARGRLPGTVTGDGRLIVLSIPVTLNKPLNTVALRAENLAGLTGYADRTVELLKR